MLWGGFFVPAKKHHVYVADSSHLISGKVNIFDSTTSAHLESNTYV